MRKSKKIANVARVSYRISTRQTCICSRYGFSHSFYFNAAHMRTEQCHLQRQKFPKHFNGLKCSACHDSNDFLQLKIKRLR